MAEVYDWLRPGDFADAGHGQVYRCLGALHHRGEPIDEVTALWEVQRRGLLADGTLSREQLDALFGGPGAGSAEWLGDQVIRASVVRTAAGAAAAIKTLAEGSAMAPGRLIGQALHALDPLDEVRARWHTANQLPSPAAEKADPAGRSDPEARVRRHCPEDRPTRRRSAPANHSPLPLNRHAGTRTGRIHHRAVLSDALLAPVIAHAITMASSALITTGHKIARTRPVHLPTDGMRVYLDLLDAQTTLVTPAAALRQLAGQLTHNHSAALDDLAALLTSPPTLRHQAAPANRRPCTSGSADMHPTAQRRSPASRAEPIGQRPRACPG
ncbi:hypothetical protein BG452_13415 [Streptomyces sp. CBMA123]|nr:hypothetical protein [Streptomyces sp. CBMA123]